MNGWAAKLSPDLRMRLAQSAAGETGERVRVLVRFHGPVARLRELGLETGNVASDIATATVPVSGLADLARAPEVIYIEGARALWPDEPTDLD
jgi:hypothetical protein